MARQNTATPVRKGGTSPIKTVTHQGIARTHEGGQGFTRDAKSELFLLAVGSFFGEDAFYEGANERSERFVRLVHTVTLDDPEWMVHFLTWLRGPDANIRTAAIVGAAEFVKARIDAGVVDAPLADEQVDQPGRGMNRRVIDAVCQRADEPAELLAYWINTHGRTVPKPVKRGLADAVRRLYSERNYLKWDSSARGVRMADVIEMVHPEPKASWQADLFKHILDVRHGNAPEQAPESLPMLRARAQFSERAQTDVSVALDSDALTEAGMTWENTLSLAGGKVDKAALWESQIPSMGVMALIRNLRNFDEAGVSDEVAAKVAAKIADPDEVAKSRQLPFRWLSSYEAVSSDRWRVALGKALDASTANIPDLPGRTLILVDTSGSMTQPVSAKSTVSAMMAAGLFGAALAKRLGPDRVTLVSYASTSKEIPMPKGGSVLAHAGKLRSGEVGHGTETAAAITKHYDGHDRIFVFTDGQAFWARGGVHGAAQGARLYTWTLGSYATTHAPSGSGNSYEVGGLSDATFRLIPMIERGVQAKWPWEQ